MSYSRTFWFQRGPLLCAGWSSTLEVWNSRFFPLGVCRDVFTSQKHCVQNQADEVVASLVSCGVVSSETEDPDEEYFKCNQSLWLKTKSIIHTHTHPIDRVCQYPHKSPSRWILLHRLKPYKEEKNFSSSVSLKTHELLEELLVFQTYGNSLHCLGKILAFQ